jgi:hypothetical protein
VASSVLDVRNSFKVCWQQHCWQQQQRPLRSGTSREQKLHLIQYTIIVRINSASQAIIVRINSASQAIALDNEDVKQPAVAAHLYKQLSVQECNEFKLCIQW